MLKEQPQYIFFLGTHAALSASEIWRLLTTRGYQPQVVAHAPAFLIVQVSHVLPADFIASLGGTSRIARVQATDDIAPTAERLAAVLSPTLVGATKLSLGISVVGMPKATAHAIGAALKKILRQQNIRVRFVVATEGTVLNAAQVLFNSLLTLPHREVVLVHYQAHFFIAFTEGVQDIQAYEQRDTARPVRLPRSGMVPPKLGQIMVNVAHTELSGDFPRTLLDPFCGSGTILQEGWLLGHRMMGSDSDPAVIAAATTNLAWIATRFSPPSELTPSVQTHDSSKPFPEAWRANIDAIVTEPYLGPPLHAPLPERQRLTLIRNLSRLYLSFFQNAKLVLKDRGVIVFLLPAFRQKGHKTPILFPAPFLDEVEALGYSRRKLIPESLPFAITRDERENAVYARPDAFVGREITIWKKLL